MFANFIPPRTRSSNSSGSAAPLVPIVCDLVAPISSPALSEEAFNLLSKLAAKGHSKSSGKWAEHNEYVQKGISALDSGDAIRIKGFIGLVKVSGLLDGRKLVPDLELLAA